MDVTRVVSRVRVPPCAHIILQEWDPEKKEYTGKEMSFIIGYIYRGTEFGMKKGYCIISLKPQNPDY